MGLSYNEWIRRQRQEISFLMKARQNYMCRRVKLDPTHSFFFDNQSDYALLFGGVEFIFNGRNVYFCSLKGWLFKRVEGKKMNTVYSFK